MKRIKILLVLLLLLGFTPMTIGCSNSNDLKQEEKEEIEKSRGVVDDFSKQLFLNGKQVKVPTTLTELGDEYSYGNTEKYMNFQQDNGITYTQGELFYKEESYARVTLYNTNNENMNRNSVICEIRFKASNTGDYALQNLKKGASREEIENTLGKPNVDDGVVLQYFNEKDDGERRKHNRIVIHLIDEKIEYFIITKSSED
ncbi:hypothetical protein ACWG0P_15715 [Amedibacillus sp. YH-ame6]